MGDNLKSHQHGASAHAEVRSPARALMLQYELQ